MHSNGYYRKSKLLLILSNRNIADGGDLQFVDYLDGIVYIRMLGTCAGCPMRRITFNNTIKANIMDQVDEVKDVVLLTD